MSKMLEAPSQSSGSNNNNNSSSNNANIPAKLHKAQSYSCSTNGPTTSSGLTTQQSLAGTSSKPMLIRQDRTSSYLASPQLSALGTSEETSDDDNARAISYQMLMPNEPTNRCRTCRPNERRSSISPNSVIYLPRSVSKESMRGSTATIHYHSVPPVFITGSPTSISTNQRIIRQSSQPEASTLSCCNSSSCSHAHQTSSLRQLKDPSDGISGIAVDALRVR